MRVLIIHNQLWAHYKSKLFSEISLALEKKDPSGEFLVAHIALHEASRAVMKDDAEFPYHYPYQVLFKKGLEEVSFRERLTALITTFNTFRPTILNVTGYFDWAQILLMVYARMKGVKIVLSSESSVADNSRSALKENIKKNILAQANAFFCFGKSSADYLLSLSVKDSQIAVRHAAVIDEEIIRANFLSAASKTTKTRRAFVYVGRLAPEKNLVMLLSAFKNITVDNDSWDLVLVGDGPSRPELEKLAMNVSNVRFAGGHPWYKVPDWLAQSDVLILPSKSEPWGLVVNEAMVCGMPVIVSEKCGCVPDLVRNEKNGFTFNPENQQELEVRMLFFITNEHIIAEMGEKSKALVAPFEAKRVAAEMVSCYENL